MDMNTNEKRDYSLINCIAGALLAYIATIPVHELYHLITHTLYGGSIRAFYATAVDNIELDLQALSPFHRIMEAGGSASILNAVTGLILVFLLPRLKNISGMLRVFLIQYTGMQLCEGFGYFLIGGFGIGDWGNVFGAFPDGPGKLMARILLTGLGAVSIPFIIFFLRDRSFDFIKDVEDKKEKRKVGLSLHVCTFIVGTAVAIAISFHSVIIEWMPLPVIFVFQLIWFPFFWGGLYTWVLKPPKKAEQIADFPTEPHIVLWILAVVLVLLDFFILAPGIMVNG